jgi:hypothetical protein
MAISYSSGQFIRSACKSYHVVDGRAGCPPAAAVGSVLLSMSITVANTAMIYTEGSMISNTINRRDLRLYVNGSSVAIGTIQNTGITTWDDRGCIWTGYLSAGTHTIDLRGVNASANIWGCQTTWGRLSALVWEVSE